MNALILHAHPDDELLFAGQLMLSRPDWQWTTVSLTGGERADRYPGITLGHRDEWRILTIPEFAQWRQSVADLALSPDVVFTHNLLGEYGHPHHMAVHRIAHELYANVWDFLCEAPSSVGAQAKGPVTWQVPVTPEKTSRFLHTYGSHVLRTLMDHQPDLMTRAFTVEAFTGTGAVPA